MPAASCKDRKSPLTLVSGQEGLRKGHPIMSMHSRPSIPHHKRHSQQQEEEPVLCEQHLPAALPRLCSEHLYFGPKQQACHSNRFCYPVVHSLL